MVLYAFSKSFTTLTNTIFHKTMSIKGLTMKHHTYGKAVSAADGLWNDLAEDDDAHGGADDGHDAAAARERVCPTRSKQQC